MTLSPSNPAQAMTLFPLVPSSIVHKFLLPTIRTKARVGLSRWPLRGVVEGVIGLFDDLIILKIMEPLGQKLDRITADVANITELYDFAEKQYPYENIRGPFQVSRQTVVHTR